MITMQEPQVMPSRRYSIKETTMLLGVARSTLNDWDKKGYIRSHCHKISMRKFYTGLDILRCWRAIV